MQITLIRMNWVRATVKKMFSRWSSQVNWCREGQICDTIHSGQRTDGPQCWRFMAQSLVIFGTTSYIGSHRPNIRYYLEENLNGMVIEWFLVILWRRGKPCSEEKWFKIRQHVWVCFLIFLFKSIPSHLEILYDYRELSIWFNEPMQFLQLSRDPLESHFDPHLKALFVRLHH